MRLDSLYQDVIMDHYRRRRGHGLREPFTAESCQVNPTCGDEIRLRVAVDGQGRIADVSYEAAGCAISQASASVLHDAVCGLPQSEAMIIESAFHALMQSRGTDAGDPEVLGDAVAFAGVSRYPARVKCALLPWMALKDALHRSEGISR